MRIAAYCIVAALLSVAASAQLPTQMTMLSWAMTPLPKASCTSPGDLNGDGVPDVVFGGGGCVKAWSGFDGTLLWQGCDSAAVLGDSVAAAGDLDLDGHSDIVVAAPGSATAAGYTTIRSGATGAEIRTIPVATLEVDGGRDFDGDGVPDQLGTFSLPTGQAGVHVFSGSTGAIIFTMDDAWCSCQATLHASFLPDVNNDGFDDLVAGFFIDVFTPTAVAVAKGPLGGLHAILTNVRMTAFERCVADVGDLNGDGQHEIGICGAFPSVLQVYDLGAGGIFSPAVPLWSFVPTLPPGGVSTTVANAVSVGDLDGDGRTDLVVSGAWSPAPAIWQNPQQHLVSGMTGSLISTSSLPPGVVVVPPVTVNLVARAGDVNLDGTPDFLHTLGSASTNCTMSVISCAPLPLAPAPLNLGGACGAIGINLWVSPLRIGSTWGIAVLGPQSTPVELVFHQGPPAPFAFGSCTWHPDLAHGASWVVLPFTLGGIAQLGIPVPMAPLLAGVSVTLQAFVHDAASPFGLSLSSGYVAVAGF